MTEHILIYTTWPDEKSAVAAGRALVTGSLAACVNILAPSTAIYTWQGDIQQDAEQPMLVKTTRARADQVVETVRRMHPYDVPAIVVLPIEGGDAEFLAWIDTQTAARSEVGSDDAKQ